MALFVIRTEEEFKIISDPFRMKIIRVLSEMPEQMATSKKVADVLGENSSKVSYHLKMLLKIGVIEFDHTEIVNGINAKYFKLLYDSFDTEFDVANELDIDLFQKNYLGLFSGVVNEFLDELQGLKFKKDEKYFGTISYEKIWLTEEDVKKIDQVMFEIADKNKSKEKDKKKFLFFSALMQMDDDEL